MLDPEFKEGHGDLLHLGETRAYGGSAYLHGHAGVSRLHPIGHIVGLDPLGSSAWDTGLGMDPQRVAELCT